MSCDTYAQRAISGLVAVGGGTALDAAQLLTVYDLPPTLQPGEDATRLRAEAKLLMVDLRRRGLEPPDHLNLDAKTGKSYIRWGRLAAGLRERGLRGGPRRSGRAPMAYDAVRRDFIQRVLVTPEVAAYFESEESAAQALEEIYRTAAMRAIFQGGLGGWASGPWQMAERRAKAAGITLYPHPTRSQGMPPVLVQEGVAAMIQTVEAIEEARRTGADPLKAMPRIAKPIAVGWQGSPPVPESELSPLPPHSSVVHRPQERDSSGMLAYLTGDLGEQILENPETAEAAYAYSDGAAEAGPLVAEALRAIAIVGGPYRHRAVGARGGTHDQRAHSLAAIKEGLILGVLLGGDGAPEVDQRAVASAALNLAGSYVCHKCGQRRLPGHVCPPDATTPEQRVAQYREELRPAAGLLAELDALDAEQGISWREAARAEVQRSTHVLSKQARHAWNRVVAGLAFRTDIPAMTRARLTCPRGIREIAQALLGEEGGA